MARTDEELVLPDAASRFHPSWIELFGATIALLVPIAYASGLEAQTWSGRAAILLVVAAVGLPILLAQAWVRGALAARSAVAFILIGSISAFFSANHTTALFGLYNQGTGLLFMVALTASWAIGRRIRPEARKLVELALIAGVLVNVGVALMASVVDLSSLFTGLLDESGRSAALTGNPVHLGALAALGLALYVPRFASSPARWAVPVAATAAAAQLSGTRTALAVMVVLVVWAGRRHGVMIGVGLACSVLLGLATASAIVPAGTSSATGRTAGGDAATSWRVRPDTWWTARHALADRPLVGIGPGQFRTATSRYRPLAVGRLEGPEKLFTDAHNIFVEYATTTGLLGAGALIVWLGVASRQGRGCLLAAALAVLAFHLFEPQSVVTTPLAFLALGASASPGAVHPWHRASLARWIIPTCVIAVAISVAAAFLIAEFDLNQAHLDLRLAPARQANRILPAWPRTASLLARVWLFDGIVGRSAADISQARSWLQIAVSRDHTDPTLWNDLAEQDESQGLTNDAKVEYLSALRFNPTSVLALNGLARIAHSRCDVEQERYWRQRSLSISPLPPASSVAALPGLQPPAPFCDVKASP